MDNRPSVYFSERGKNHKENVSKRVCEIKQESLEKGKEEERGKERENERKEVKGKNYGQMDGWVSE